MAKISIKQSCPISPWERPHYIQRGEVSVYFSKANMGRDGPRLRNIEILSKRIGLGDAKGSSE